MLLGVSTVVTTKIRGRKPSSYPKKDDDAQGTTLQACCQPPLQLEFLLQNSSGVFLCVSFHREDISLTTPIRK